MTINRASEDQMLYGFRNQKGTIVRHCEKTLDRYCEILKNGKTIFIYPFICMAGNYSKNVTVELTDIRFESLKDIVSIESVVIFKSPTFMKAPPFIEPKTGPARFKQIFNIITATATTLTLLNYDVYLPHGNPKNPPADRFRPNPPGNPLECFCKAGNPAMVLFSPREIRNLSIDLVAIDQPKKLMI